MEFLLRARNGHVYCVTLVRSLRHIVLCAFVALSVRALYPRPLAHHERQKPHEMSGLISSLNFHPCIVGFQDFHVVPAGFRHKVRAGLAHAYAVTETSAGKNK